MATASSINEPVLCREESGLTEQKTFEFASIADAVRDLKAGRVIVVVDDEDRENEGDLMIAAEMITPKAINLMATQGRGLICLAMTGDRLDQLELAPMVSCNSALGGTAFTVSIDARCDGVTTGISAHDRVLTTRTAIDPNSYPEDLARPGHVFPLRARPGGVLERQGHTEANPLTASRMTRRQVAATVVEFGDERVTVVGRCGDETVEAALLRAGRP
jgi:3,4-dihydroxy 2-butanone 4-phosphate synthase/GTP cyclohydrolase II